MEHLLIEECCPECGHILPNSRTGCAFCSWSSLERPTSSDMDQLYSIDEILVDGDFSYALPQNDVTATQAIL